ncbi:MAG: pyruvate formate lyase family protein, partial [Clostridia bacterium]|nr:pyruvate formate lyase family protein [Clostridia bacterium]
MKKMSERVRILRERSLATQPRICLERARIETEVYKRYEGTVSIPELRALVLYHYMAERTLVIEPGELIVGEKASGMQAAPTFPELCCHTLEDMRVMNERELVSFSVTENDLAQQEKTILPHWEKRSMRTRLLAAMTDEWKACYEAGMFTEFMEQRGPGHTVG